MGSTSEVSILDLLPPSISNDSNVKASTKALDIELKKVLTFMEQTNIIIPNISTMPETVIDLLAWQYHVDYYEHDLSLNKKRNMVRVAIDAHRHKGTPYAVELVVKSILDDGVVQEWFEYGGEPYHFQVNTQQAMQSVTAYERLINMIAAAKNTRSHLEKIVISRKSPGDLNMGHAIYSGKTITIEPALQFNIHNKDSVIAMGGVLLSGKTITIIPEEYVINNDKGQVQSYLGLALLSGKTITI